MVSSAIFEDTDIWGVLWSGVKGFLLGGLSACGPAGFVASIGFGMLFTYTDSLDSGASDNMSLFNAIISGVSSLLSTDSGSAGVDAFTDSVFGFPKDLGLGLISHLIADKDEDAEVFGPPVPMHLRSRHKEGFFSVCAGFRPFLQVYFEAY